MSQLIDLSITEAGRRMAAGTLTAEALALAFLERIEEREVEVGAFEHFEPARFLAEARLRDREPRRSPIHGVPIAVKDIFDTADMPTTYGSRIFQGYRPRADAAVVAIARAAGAVVMGKTVTTEFAAIAPGKTRNPRHTGHTPGGSSSGSAAAVAAGMAPLAFGSQTAGSVIRPASFCGVVGYKATFGRIDRTGCKTLAQSCDTVGLFARNVADAAALAAVLADRPGSAPVEPAMGPRLGIYRTAMADRAAEEALAALAAAAAAAEQAGAAIADVPAWSREASLLAAHEAILAWEVPHALSYERLNHFDLLQPKTRDFISPPMPTPGVLDRSRKEAASGIAAIEELFGDYDALLTLASPGAAPAGLGSTGEATFNRVWTLLTVPCIAVPAIRTASGLPVGVQVVARAGADEQAFAVAAFLENALAHMAH